MTGFLWYLERPILWQFSLRYNILLINIKKFDGMM